MPSFSNLFSTLWCILLQFHISLCQQQLIHSLSMNTPSKFNYAASVDWVTDSNCNSGQCFKMTVSNPSSWLETKLGELDTTGYESLTLRFTFLYANWGLGYFTIYQQDDTTTNSAASIAQFDHDDVNQNQQVPYAIDLDEDAEDNSKLGILFMTGTSSSNPTGNVVYIDDIQLYGIPIPQHPTKSPTHAPTSNPTPSPTTNPTPAPTANPTHAPTANPTPSPTMNPTPTPTMNPTLAPTSNPTKSPSKSPITSQPTTNAPTTTNKPTIDGISHLTPTMRPTENHQEVDEGTTESPEGHDQEDKIKEAGSKDGSTTALAITCVILALIIICGIIFVAKRRHKKKSSRKVSDNLYDYGQSNKASNIKAIGENENEVNEGEGIEISTNINNDSIHTGTATGVDTNSDDDDELDDEIVDEINEENMFVTKGGRSNSSIIIEGEEKRKRINTFVVEDENEIEEDVIIGIDTKGNFEQNVGDNALGNDLLMNDIVNDMNNNNNIDTPQ